jgi:hypothetical protein
MNHEELLKFEIYRKACFASQAMCHCLVNYIEEKHGLRPIESASGFLQWTPNFALIQTLGVRNPNLTINLSGKESNYHGIGVDDLFSKPWTGLTRLRFTSAGRVADMIAAAERAYRIKTRP